MQQSVPGRRANGVLTPKNRHVLTEIIQVLHKANGIQSLKDANQLLASGHYHLLTEVEIQQIDKAWLPNTDMKMRLPAKHYRQFIGREDELNQISRFAPSRQHPFFTCRRGK